jgi:hypothetical protein
MSTIEAQCLLAHLLSGASSELLPSRWRHGRDGHLSWSLPGGESTFSWDADAVAEAAERSASPGRRRSPRP